MEVDEILSIEYCECGRPWCDFFNASGNYSLSVEKVEETLKALPKIERHLKRELAKYKRGGKRGEHETPLYHFVELH